MRIIVSLLIFCSVIYITGCTEQQIEKPITRPNKLPIWEADSETKYLPVLLERADNKEHQGVKIYYMDGTELKSETLQGTGPFNSLKVFVDVPQDKPIWAKTKWEVDRTRGQQYRALHEIHLHTPNEFPIK